MKELTHRFLQFDQSAAEQLRMLKNHEYDDRRDFRAIIRDYVNDQFLLEDGDCDSDNLIELSQCSLSKMRGIDPDILRRISESGCRQSTAVIDKKTTLISTLEKKLGVKISMRDYPLVKTVQNLADTLYGLLNDRKFPPSNKKGLDVQTLKQDFPILSRTQYGHDFIYLDNAATTQKPGAVIRKITELYSAHNANVHRSNYALGREMTQLYEEARMAVQDLIHARSSSEIVFTAGATDAINLLAFSFGEARVHPGDEIIITQMEHHSNFVPWQALCQRKNAVLKILPVLPDGTLDMQALPALLGSRTKLLAVTHVSNAIGTVNPVREIAALCRANHTAVLVDASQSVPHMTIDVQDMDCDFLAFSGHKLYGPTGTGVLYAKDRWLAELPPYRTGGAMIDRVGADETTYNVPPYKFEAGTPNLIGAAGLHEAIRFLQGIGMDAVGIHEKGVLTYAIAQLSRIPGVHILGAPQQRIGVVSFFADGIADDDLGRALDKLGIAVRAGAHCAQPLLRAFSRESSVRASIGVYNTAEDIDLLCGGIERCIKEAL